MRQTRCISLSMFNVLGVDQTAYLRLNVQHNDCGWRVHYAEIDSGTHVTNCYKICSRVVAMVLDRGDLGVYISNISQGSSDVFPPQWRNYEGGGGTVKHVLPLGCPAPPFNSGFGGESTTVTWSFYCFHWRRKNTIQEFSWRLISKIRKETSKYVENWINNLCFRLVNLVLAFSSFPDLLKKKFFGAFHFGPCPIKKNSGFTGGSIA